MNIAKREEEEGKRGKVLKKTQNVEKEGRKREGRERRKRNEIFKKGKEEFDLKCCHIL